MAIALFAIMMFLIGAFTGYLIAQIADRPHPVGNLRIDNSDPDDGPYLFLELSSESTPNLLKLKKYVTLEVKAENYVSHK
jgi:hypothetical protein